MLHVQQHFNDCMESSHILQYRDASVRNKKSTLTMLLLTQLHTTWKSPIFASLFRDPTQDTVLHVFVRPPLDKSLSRLKWWQMQKHPWARTKASVSTWRCSPNQGMDAVSRNIAERSTHLMLRISSGFQLLSLHRWQDWGTRRSKALSHIVRLAEQGCPPGLLAPKPWLLLTVAPRAKCSHSRMGASRNTD